MLSSYQSLLMLFSPYIHQRILFVSFPSKTELSWNLPHIPAAEVFIVLPNAPNKGEIQGSFSPASGDQTGSSTRVSIKKSIIGNYMIEKFSSIEGTWSEVSLFGWEQMQMTYKAACNWFAFPHQYPLPVFLPKTQRSKQLTASHSPLRRKARQTVPESPVWEQPQPPARPWLAVRRKQERHTHLSPGSQSDSEPANWKHT